MKQMYSLAPINGPLDTQPVIIVNKVPERDRYSLYVWNGNPRSYPIQIEMLESQVKFLEEQILHLFPQ